MSNCRRTRITRFGWLLDLLAFIAATSYAPAAANAAQGRDHRITKTWSISRNGSIVQIGYGSGKNFPEFAALDLRSSYFRLVYGRTSGFGTFIVLLPALWSRSSCPTDYCQGAPVTAAWRKSGANLTFTIHGTIATLKVTSTVTMRPPAHNSFVIGVSTTTSGTISLDSRPGEAFKPVMLSSMHVSPARWDARNAFIAARAYSFPASGWIVHPPVTAADFGLQGGTSAWKKNAPTIEVTLKRQRQVTGWLTASQDPREQNVGFWCATASVLSSWRYSVTAESGSNR